MGEIKDKGQKTLKFPSKYWVIYPFKALISDPMHLVDFPMGECPKSARPASKDFYNAL